MNWILIVLFSAIPVFIIMKLVYDMDDIEKEPIKMLALLFIGGVISWVLVKYTSNLLNGHVYELSAGSPFLKQDWEFFLISFGMIAVVEELSKFLLLNVLCWRSKQFDYPYDGIVYAVFVSLGFAFTENLMYLNQYGLGVAFSRGIFSIPAHAIFGVLMGYYIGLAKSCKKRNMLRDCTKLRYYAFFIPLVFHGIYDYICNFTTKNIYYIFICYVVAMYVIAIIKIKKLHDLEYDIYRRDEQTNDKLDFDNYQEKINIQSEKVQQQLFSNEPAQPDVQQAQNNTNNFKMAMFSGDDEESNQNN